MLNIIYDIVIKCYIKSTVHSILEESLCYLKFIIWSVGLHIDYNNITLMVMRMSFLGHYNLQNIFFHFRDLVSGY